MPDQNYYTEDFISDISNSVDFLLYFSINSSKEINEVSNKIPTLIDHVNFILNQSISFNDDGMITLSKLLLKSLRSFNSDNKDSLDTIFYGFKLLADMSTSLYFGKDTTSLIGYKKITEQLSKL